MLAGDARRRVVADEPAGHSSAGPTLADGPRGRDDDTLAPGDAIPDCSDVCHAGAKPDPSADADAQTRPRRG